MAIFLTTETEDTFEEKLPPVLKFPSISSKGYTTSTVDDHTTLKTKIYFFNCCYDSKCISYLAEDLFKKTCEKIIKETKSFWEKYFTMDFDPSYINDGTSPTVLGEGEILINMINESGRSYVQGGRIGVYYCVGIKTKTIQHEFGHFTGLGDRYNYVLTYNMLKEEIITGANVSYIELKTVGTERNHVEDDIEYLKEYKWIRNLYSLGRSFMDSTYKDNTTDDEITYEAYLITKRQQDIIANRTVENVAGSQLFFVFPSRKTDITSDDRFPLFRLSFVGLLDGSTVISDINHNSKTGDAKERILKTVSGALKNRLNICFRTNEPFDRSAVGKEILFDIPDFYIKAFGKAKTTLRVFFLSYIKHSDKEKYQKMLKDKEENITNASYLLKICNRHLIPIYEEFKEVFSEFGLIDDFNEFDGKSSSNGDIFINNLSYLNLFKDYTDSGSGIIIDNQIVARNQINLNSTTFYSNDSEVETIWNKKHAQRIDGLSKTVYTFFPNRLKILWLDYKAILNTQPESDYTKNCQKICSPSRLMEIISQLRTS